MENVPNGEKISIYSVTWNMGGKTPNPQDLKLLLPQTKKYDMYIIGTEECLRSIFLSILFPSKSEWEKAVMSQFDSSEYSVLTSVTLAALHLIVIVKKKLKVYIKNIHSNVVKTGMGNIMGNKGAVCIWFTYKDLSFLFVDLHLASGKKNQDKRNENFDRIMENIPFQDIDKLFKQPLKFFYTKNSKEIVLLFDFCIFMGDFNYRLDKDFDYIRSLIANKMNYIGKEAEVIEKLIKFDQRKRNGTDLIEFHECPITFMPTFKFVKDTSEYWFQSDNKLHGWTDRILYKYNLSKLQVNPIQYNSIPDIKTSDHKPVYLNFEIEIKS